MSVLIFVGLSYLLFVLAMGVTKLAWAEIEIENEASSSDDPVSLAPFGRKLAAWFAPTNWRPVRRLAGQAQP
jgi:hypothetical protein